MDEDILFAEEDSEPSAPTSGGTWKVLIVDDEREVHSVTRLVLRDHEILGRRLELLSAYSGAEARTIMAAEPDIAVVLLDVVMERDHAGLETVRFIRDELGNHLTRIVLRTGQPGQAPETRIIADYDINDYKEKSDLTAQKLYTVLYSTLRAYRDIVALDQQGKGLAKIIDSSMKLLRQQRNRSRFISEALDGAKALVPAIDGVLFVEREPHGLELAGASGKYSGRYPDSGPESGGASFLSGTPEGERVSRCLETRAHLFGNEGCAAYFQAASGVEGVLCLDYAADPAPSTRSLIDVWLANLEIAWNNLRLTQELEHTQQEMIYLRAYALTGRRLLWLR
jgi:CheY-like chemotaxis protein